MYHQLIQQNKRLICYIIGWRSLPKYQQGLQCRFWLMYTLIIYEKAPALTHLLLSVPNSNHALERHLTSWPWHTHLWHTHIRTDYRLRQGPWTCISECYWSLYFKHTSKRTLPNALSPCFVVDIRGVTDGINAPYVTVMMLNGEGCWQI